MFAKKNSYGFFFSFKQPITPDEYIHHSSSLNAQHKQQKGFLQ